ncbi:hypothetical protein F5Y16DRAFT_374477 [Xylariaceae sp. FL0255]|nr:hypothetical protein F5Y16DRAFT_374477 [Xylariaceae sp. FL0255]
MARKFDQLVRFTTDAVGIERTLRLFQATTHILTSYSLPLECLLLLLNTISTTIASTPSSSSSGKPPFTPTTALPALIGVRSHLGLVRRHFRIFRWIEQFSSAHKAWGSLSAPTPVSSSGKSKSKPEPRWTTLDLWLDVFGKTFNGLYLLMDATVLPDAFGVPGFGIYGPDRWSAVSVEANKFWFLALVCGAAAGVVRILKVLLYTPLPPQGQGGGYGLHDGSAGNEREENEKGKGLKEVKGDGDEVEDEPWDLKKEQARLRDIVSRRKLGRKAWRREVGAKISALSRRALADSLDTVLPGYAVGWVSVRPGTVGIAMFITTLLTGYDAWERCGREVGVSK